MIAGISISWIIIPGIEFNSAPDKNAFHVNPLPPTPSSITSVIPQTILPAIIAVISER